ncbi:dynamin family protein [Bisgaard Taxon 45]
MHHTINTKPIYEVVVIATMSAGKSTIINALIGQELLHSANEATTATITRIHDKDDLPYFSGDAYSYKNERLYESDKIDANEIKRWNADPTIKTIHLEGNIEALHNDVMDIVIYDTPGPNNSQDDNHEELTMEVIENGNFGLILYVLNATQLGVNDDYSLLHKIQESFKKNKEKEIIFLLNKADMLDSEKGENIETIINKTKHYLMNIGFIEPIIIPTSANQALICQKVINREKITKTQLADLRYFTEHQYTDFIIKSETPAEFKLKCISKMKKLNNKKITFYNIRNSFKISNIKLLKSYMNSGFGIVSLILQKKLKTSHTHYNTIN